MQIETNVQLTKSESRCVISKEVWQGQNSYWTRIATTEIKQNNYTDKIKARATVAIWNTTNNFNVITQRRTFNRVVGYSKTHIWQAIEYLMFSKIRPMDQVQKTDWQFLEPQISTLYYVGSINKWRYICILSSQLHQSNLEDLRETIRFNVSLFHPPRL